MRIGDSKHEIIDLSEGVELHRFLNMSGEPYSALHVGDFEAFSCERNHEEKMLAKCLPILQRGQSQKRPQVQINCA